MRKSKEVSLSKEDMALEALIKLVTEIKSHHADEHFNLQSLDYANIAMQENGWEIADLGFGRFKARKIEDAQKA